MAKNLEIGSTVGIRAGAVDADAENNNVTYHLTDTEGWFDINQSTGEVTLAEDVREQPLDVMTLKSKPGVPTAHPQEPLSRWI